MNSKVIVTEGLEELGKKLAALDAWVESDVLKQGCKNGAQLIADAAKALAPRKTGKLAAAIKVRAGRKSNNSVAYLASVGKGWNTGTTFYGAFQEFGWKSGPRTSHAKNAAAHDTRRQNPGEHFMQYAAEEKGPEALAQFVQTVSAAIEREFKK